MNSWSDDRERRDLEGRYDGRRDSHERARERYREDDEYMHGHEHRIDRGRAGQPGHDWGQPREGDGEGYSRVGGGPRREGPYRSPSRADEYAMYREGNHSGYDTWHGHNYYMSHNDRDAMGSREPSGWLRENDDERARGSARYGLGSRDDRDDRFGAGRSRDDRDRERSDARSSQGYGDAGGRWDDRGERSRGEGDARRDAGRGSYRSGWESQRDTSGLGRRDDDERGFGGRDRYSSGAQYGGAEQLGRGERGGGERYYSGREQYGGRDSGPSGREQYGGGPGSRHDADNPNRREGYGGRYEYGDRTHGGRSEGDRHGSSGERRDERGGSSRGDRDISGTWRMFDAWGDTEYGNRRSQGFGRHRGDDYGDHWGSTNERER